MKNITVTPAEITIAAGAFTV
ncbi:hypothetical protein [Bacteroides thetaiotaomicron]